MSRSFLIKLAVTYFAHHQRLDTQSDHQRLLIDARMSHTETTVLTEDKGEVESR